MFNSARIADSRCANRVSTSARETLSRPAFVQWLQLPSVGHRQTLPDDPPNVDGGGTEEFTAGIVGASDPLETAPGGTLTALEFIDEDVVNGIVFIPATTHVEVVVEHTLGFRFLLRLATPQWTELFTVLA